MSESPDTMSEYTPTTEEIREYVTVGDPKPWEAPSPEVDAREARREAAFNRWLAAHDAEVAAKALEHKEAAYQAVRDSGLLTDDAYVNARIWRAVEAALGARIREGEQ